MAARPVLSIAETRAAERGAMSRGLSGAELMARAGEAAASFIRKAWDARPVVVLCGPGNNGGDGFVVARALKDFGWPVVVAPLGRREALRGEAALMASLWTGPVAPFEPASLAGCGLIVDAIFGVGLARPVDGSARAMIEAVNAHTSPAVALDLPSGIHADTGMILGSAVEAAATIAFFAQKPAHLLFPGRRLSGAVHVADLGLQNGDFEYGAFENGPGAWISGFPKPSAEQHKYQRGHVAVVSGPRLRTGAARLAARAALRAGAGLVTMLSPSDACDENAAHLTAVMIREANTAEDIAATLGDSRYRAIVLGPGAGVDEQTRRNVLAALSSPAAAVLDADALTSFADDPATLFTALRRSDVLTPHAGEFTRLFPDIAAADLGKLEAARRAAKRCGAVVLLKGADTVIAAPERMAAINANAPPHLATAGSGDVLAGIIAGLAAQGMNAFDAACAGSWLHGSCGSLLGRGLIAEDLPEAVPAVLRELDQAVRDRRNAPGGRP